MFDKFKFAYILKKIKETYSSQEEFSRFSGVGRTYISQYINMKIDVPPKPKILEKLASSSKQITTYNELMQICGYTNSSEKNKLVDNDIAVLPLFVSNNENLEIYGDIWLSKSILDSNKQYFAYQVQNDDMLPLLGTNDIAIIEKTTKYENGETCLICLDNRKILIRKIIIFTDYLELHTAFPYTQPIKITIKEKTPENFKILGKVIRAENTSAFK